MTYCFLNLLGLFNISARNPTKELEKLYEFIRNVSALESGVLMILLGITNI